MKKIKWAVSTAAVMAATLMLAACANTAIVPSPSVEPAASAEGIQQTQVTVYYGNSGSLELKYEDAAIEQLTPETLIGSLAKHNIVSLDTKVNSFEEEEDADGKVLKLDLSGSFREYLKNMSENGEKVILASVTNTFLEAYEAELIQITVDGDPLETSYGSYGEPMRYMQSKEE